MKLIFQHVLLRNIAAPLLSNHDELNDYCERTKFVFKHLI